MEQMESEEAEEARVHKADCQRGEGCMEGELGSCADCSPQAFSRALISICMWGNVLKPLEKYLKVLQGKVIRAYTEG